ncbi:hypothetical protein [Pontibacter burrus]|uniref:Uncharacterized protein n=1 Tax=Pontibacter burrus TaxID=2704466 RepID=A0A6B3LVL0_9BACT|nr:hypothetical protein [Pontibacter burrus]NEM97471.1 hypothetical protein [Pontibacter burrus]
MSIPKNQTVEISFDKFIMDYYVDQAGVFARQQSILSNQARILSLLENRDFEEVKKEVYERVEVNLKASLESTYELMGFKSSEDKENK